MCEWVFHEIMNHFRSSSIIKFQNPGHKFIQPHCHTKRNSIWLPELQDLLQMQTEFVTYIMILSFNQVKKYVHMLRNKNMGLVLFAVTLRLTSFCHVREFSLFFTVFTHHSTNQHQQHISGTELFHSYWNPTGFLRSSYRWILKQVQKQWW
jgi:hypothetical protein